MVGQLQPLDQKFSIVDAQGRPNLYFIKWAQQKQIDIGAGITAAEALAIVVQYLQEHQLQEGSGVLLTPTGNLTDTPTISAEVQAILDQITNVQGSVLFRGAAGWDELLPGTAGHFLKTNGAGANPEWAAGGGGGGNWWFVPPTAASFSLQSGDATNLSLADDADVGLMIGGGVSVAGDEFRMAYRTLTTPANNWVLTTKFEWSLDPANFVTFGLAMHDSVGGRVVDFGFRNDGQMTRQRLNSLTSFNAEALLAARGAITWFQMEKNGVNVFYRWSADGKVWHTWFSETATSWLANNPNRVGFGILYNRVGPTTEYSCPYFSLTGTAV